MIKICKNTNLFAFTTLPLNHFNDKTEKELIKIKNKFFVYQFELLTVNGNYYQVANAIIDAIECR